MPEEKNQQPAVRRPRNLAFDVMNVLSCLAVIALHHNALVHSFHPTRGWVQSLVVECVCYWAVPVFMMILFLSTSAPCFLSSYILPSIVIG